MDEIQTFLKKYSIHSIDLNEYDQLIIRKLYESLEIIFRYPYDYFEKPNEKEQIIINRLKIEPYKSLLIDLKLNKKAEFQINNFVNWNYNYILRMQRLIEPIYNHNEKWYIGTSISNTYYSSFKVDYLNLAKTWNNLNITLINNMRINSIKIYSDNSICVPWSFENKLIISLIKNPFVKILSLQIGDIINLSSLMNLELKFPNLEYICLSNSKFLYYKRENIELIKHYLPKGIKIVNCSIERLICYLYNLRFKFSWLDDFEIKYISNFDNDEPQFEFEEFGFHIHSRFFSNLPKLTDETYKKYVSEMSDEPFSYLDDEDIIEKPDLEEEELYIEEIKEYGKLTFEFRCGIKYEVPERIIKNSIFLNEMIGEEKTENYDMPFLEDFSYEIFKRFCEIIQNKDYLNYIELVTPEMNLIKEWLLFKEELIEEINKYSDYKTYKIIERLKSNYPEFKVNMLKDLKSQLSEIEEMEFFIGLKINEDGTKENHKTRLINDKDVFKLEANYNGTINISILNKIMTNGLIIPFVQLDLWRDGEFKLKNYNISILEIYDNRKHLFGSKIDAFELNDILQIIKNNCNIKYICGPPILFNLTHDQINDIFKRDRVYIVNSTYERLKIDPCDYEPFHIILKPVIKDMSVVKGISYADKLKKKTKYTFDLPDKWIEEKIKKGSAGGGGCR